MERPATSQSVSTCQGALGAVEEIQRDSRLTLFLPLVFEDVVVKQPSAQQTGSVSPPIPFRRGPQGGDERTQKGLHEVSPNRTKTLAFSHSLSTPLGRSGQSVGSRHSGRLSTPGGFGLLRSRWSAVVKFIHAI